MSHKLVLVLLSTKQDLNLTSLRPYISSKMVRGLCWLISSFTVRQYRYCNWLELPFGLSLELGIKALVMKLGEPQKKHGGREIPITLTYNNLPDAPDLGLQCEFTGTLWEDSENELQSLTFFSNRLSR
eukprot:Protomagalhaensia_sp_Gyna_25__1422@NODE_1718_length_1589_cov_26_588387_g1407_i0_p2_GENE_NODE_1718_length_1589_cov_26_588387_g1407_i0NODE_1718_length_1589_cov_26_588387_g1407_i0_p2_ORF_typecomplete_len128_score8_02_NODE_1718_length_1589_cov_26_588387_g1407_i011011484